MMWSMHERMQNLEARYGFAHGKKIESSKAFLSLHDAVPCILHLENWVGLNFSLCCFMLACQMPSVATCSLFWQHKAIDLMFFASINDIVNTIVIGTDFNLGQWDCPKDKAKKEVGIICLDKNQTQKVINSFDLFVDMCIVNENKKKQWKASIGHYHEDMKLLCKKLASWKLFKAMLISFLLYGLL